MNPAMIIVWIGLSINPGYNSDNELKFNLYPTEADCLESALLHEERVCIPVGSTQEYLEYVQKQHEENLKKLKYELELKEKLKYEMCMESVPSFLPKDGENYKVFAFRCHQKVYGNKK